MCAPASPRRRRGETSWEVSDLRDRHVGPSVDEVSAALARLLDHPEVGGGRRERLLHHLVAETLAGRADKLKGASIAMDVFGRDASFDPQVDAVVRTEARRLRQALASYYVGDGAQDPVVITVPKGSYVPRFERRVPSGASHGAAVEPNSTGEARRNDRSMLGDPERAASPVREAAPRRARRAAAAVAILFCVAVGGWRLQERMAAGAVSAGLTAPSVLVTPFDASGAGAEIEALAIGLTAQLIADLMRFPSLRLYTLTDSIALSGRPPSAETEAPAGATYVVQGVMRGDDESLSVVVRLSEAGDGRVLWSDAFSRALVPEALVALQTEISGEIASTIGQTYGVVRGPLADAAGDASAAGMSSFSCVMQAYAYRQTNSSDQYPSVRACLEAATVRDPAYAEAWAMLAYIRLDGGRFGYDAHEEAERSAPFASARAAAARALALEPGNVQATKALSLVEHYAGRYAESVRLAREAIDLNPNDPDTLAHLGWRLSVRGRFDEGIPYLERAIARSVRPPAWYFQPIAVERLLVGDMAGMLLAAERAAADGSSVSDALRAIAHAGLGDTEEALAALDAMARKWPLLARDPAAAFRLHHLGDDLVEAIVEGLRAAGWSPPEHG